MIYLALFLIGLCVGSFLNVLIYREAVDEEKREKKKEKRENFLDWLPDWITGRSYCDHCKKKLSWLDNIPLLSYLFLAGKCRYCHKKIPVQYPLVEFLSGIQFVWVYFLIQSNLNFFSRFEGFYSLLTLLILLGLGACLLSIFVADVRYQIIPDTTVFGGMGLALMKILIDYRYTGLIDWSLLTAAFLAAGFFLGLVLVTAGKGMGVGDVKLAFLMGLVLGIPRILYSLCFSFLTGAAVGVILIIWGKKGLKSKIAFGPFLIAGTVFALLYA